jgi:hypothetical protein
MAETPTTNNRQPMTDSARERQRDGQYKGLLHAAEKRKADNSANYATNFKHGQMAFDFERSAEAAGETREEVRSHSALLDRTLLTVCGWFKSAAAALPRLPLHTDATSPRAPKLVRALGLLLWRPLRLYGMQENWERLAICYRLDQMKRWRQRHGDLTVERAQKFHWDLDVTLHNYDSHLSPRLKKIEKRFWKVWRLYRALVGVASLVFGTRDAELPIADSELPIADCRLPIKELPTADCRLPIEEPQAEAESPINRHQSQIDNWESAIENRQSAIENRQSTIGNPLIVEVRDSRNPNPESRELNADRAAGSSGGDLSVTADHKAQVTNSEFQIGNRQSAIL